jgi:hypothetical protein
MLFRTEGCFKVGVLLLSLTFFSACVDRQGGAALADAGVTVSNSLANYYSGLATQVTQTIELEAFNSAIRDILPPPQSEINKTIKALQERRVMASQLGNVYVALKNLSAYDASGEVKEKATNLAATVTKLVPLPGVDISPLIGEAAGDLAELKQSRDIVKGLKSIQKLVVGVQSIFSSERELYVSFATDRGNKVTSISELFIDKGWLGTSDLIQVVPQVVGVRWTGPKSLPGNEKAVKALLRTRIVRYTSAAEGAAQAEDSALGGLVQQQAGLLSNDKKLDVPSILSLISKANAYLTIIENLENRPATTTKE